MTKLVTTKQLRASKAATLVSASGSKVKPGWINEVRHRVPAEVYEVLKSIAWQERPMMIAVAIPVAFIPIIKGYAALSNLTPTEFAQRAVLKYCTGDDCSEAMDNVINAALRDV